MIVNRAIVHLLDYKVQLKEELIVDHFLYKTKLDHLFKELFNQPIPELNQKISAKLIEISSQNNLSLKLIDDALVLLLKNKYIDNENVSLFINRISDQEEKNEAWIYIENIPEVEQSDAIGKALSLLDELELDDYDKTSILEFIGILFPEMREDFCQQILPLLKKIDRDKRVDVLYFLLNFPLSHVKSAGEALISIFENDPNSSFIDILSHNPNLIEPLYLHLEDLLISKKYLRLIPDLLSQILYSGYRCFRIEKKHFLFKQAVCQYIKIETKLSDEEVSLLTNGIQDFKKWFSVLRFFPPSLLKNKVKMISKIFKENFHENWRECELRKIFAKTLLKKSTIESYSKEFITNFGSKKAYLLARRFVYYNKFLHWEENFLDQLARKNADFPTNLYSLKEDSELVLWKKRMIHIFA